jgi:hypothetical protein
MIVTKDRTANKGRSAKSQQVPIILGTRVKVEFKDEGCWYAGVVYSQHATGTVVHFDDGDVQDLNLNTIKWASLNGCRRRR